MPIAAAFSPMHQEEYLNQQRWSVVEKREIIPYDEQQDQHGDTEKQRCPPCPRRQESALKQRPSVSRQRQEPNCRIEKEERESKFRQWFVIGRHRARRGQFLRGLYATIVRNAEKITHKPVA